MSIKVIVIFDDVTAGKEIPSGIIEGFILDINLNISSVFITHSHFKALILL